MRYALTAALLILVSGCASPASSLPPVSPTSAAGSTDSHPPNDPSDLIKPRDYIVGTVTAGGTGPCYGLETDDGKQYALHSTAGIELTKGTRIKIKTQAARVRIDCGPGMLLELISAEPLR
ncbi:hypothetical protein ACQP2F_01525 [Actinoplanes sp. CA-030573]|uniref:hypothetical protein n=1 Tax=Actinoplanes sp. CA-030573 TaxID=3239898 RepID=UPI003D8F768B